jgi:protein-tyrosine kinase
LDHIREALSKAHASLDNVPGAAPALSRPSNPSPHQPQAIAQKAPETPRSWAPRQVVLEPGHLESNRIVSAAMSDPSHVAFNVLRTRVRKIMQDNHWKMVGITSATPGCGKTMVGLNLAFSLSRGSDCRTVLVDLDLKKPAVARTLGIRPNGSVGEFLKGRSRIEDCFVEINPNLIIGLNKEHTRDSSELIQSAQMGALMDFITKSIAPDIILFDLPPMWSGDDTLAFLPMVDTALLVVAADKTTVAEADECEQQISQASKLLGVVLNKSRSEDRQNYYY